MQTLVAPIENAVLAEQTALYADIAAGDTTLTVYNTQGFVANDFIIVGNIGYEKAELLQISSVTSPDTIVLKVACSFVHIKNENIQKILYNQRKFYKSATSGGTYVHLSAAGSPVAIDVDNAEGNIFEDPDGTTTSYYKATYYNTYTSKETDVVDSLSALAGDSDHYTSIYKIKNEAGFKDNPYIDSDLIDRYRLEAEEEVESMLVGIYTLPLPKTSKMLQHIVTLLAAGLLLSKEYGMESDVEIGKTGERKIQRAEDLLNKILEKKIFLIESGAISTMSSGKMASCSNQYDSDVYDRGSLFTLENEQFRMADPTDGIGSTERNTTDVMGNFK